MKKIIRLTERDLTRLVKRTIKEMYEDEYTADQAIEELEDYVYSNTQLGKNQLLSDISRMADSAAEELSDEEYDKFMNYYDDLEIQILQELPDDEEDDYEY
jgi:hypothetical protein